jgi:hypothetical protein
VGIAKALYVLSSKFVRRGFHGRWCGHIRLAEHEAQTRRRRRPLSHHEADRGPLRPLSERSRQDPTGVNNKFLPTRSWRKPIIAGDKHGPWQLGFLWACRSPLGRGLSIPLPQSTGKVASLATYAQDHASRHIGRRCRYRSRSHHHTVSLAAGALSIA